MVLSRFRRINLFTGRVQIRILTDEVLKETDLTVADPAAGFGGGGWARNMISMLPPLEANFLSLIFTELGGIATSVVPLPGSATA